MELQFKQYRKTCLETAVQDIRNMELTQEIRIPDGMPDIGQILCAWGQTVLRGKEWRRDSLSFSGGMMVWILYVPEDGAEATCMEGWIPFQMRWDLPEDCPEGTVRIQCMTRFVDARSVSARKILVRAGVGAQAEAYIPKEITLWEPNTTCENLELLQTQWPLRLPVEAGERSFLLDEEADLSGGDAQAEKIVSFRLDPKVAEKRILGNKLVFRGTGMLHMLCRCADGQLRSWDLELPFSQFAQLQQEYGPDAQCDVLMSPTSLEPELEENGRLRFKGGLTAQYLVTDRHLVTAAQDAYSLQREVNLQMEQIQIPVILENRREPISGSQYVPGEGERVVEVSFLPDFPRQHTVEDGIALDMPGQIQVLYYDTEGNLKSGTARWEGRLMIPADETTNLRIVPEPAETPRISEQSGKIQVNCRVPLEITAVTEQRIPMLKGVELAELRQKDPHRPSLILRRAGEARLWDIAKSSGSTVESIRRINGIASEAAPDQLLMIPIS